MISKERVEEFRTLYFKEYGEQISFEDAQDRFLRLVELFKVIARPIPVGEAKGGTQIG